MSATTTSVPTPMFSSGSKGNGEPLLAPGPDPARVVPAADLPGDEGGVADHALNPVEHVFQSISLGRPASLQRPGTVPLHSRTTSCSSRSS